jgi:hypothetical protein
MQGCRAIGSCKSALAPEWRLGLGSHSSNCLEFTWTISSCNNWQLHQIWQSTRAVAACVGRVGPTKGCPNRAAVCEFLMPHTHLARPWRGFAGSAPGLVMGTASKAMVQSRPLHLQVSINQWIMCP